MSEVVHQEPSETEAATMSESLDTNDVPTPPKQTAGQALRRARESAGVSIASIAGSLKVSSKTIVALEGDNAGALPDLAFTRALMSSICRTLKVDPAPILGLMPSLPQRNAVPQPEVGIQLPIGRHFNMKPSLSWVRSSTFLIVASIVLATFGVLNWNTVTQWAASIQSGGQSAATVLTEVPSEVRQSVATDATQPSQLAPEGAMSGTGIVKSDASIVTQVVLPVASGAVTSTSSPTAPALPASSMTRSTVGTKAESEIVFKVTQSTWVEVSDMTGKGVWKKLLARDESAVVNTALPVRVLVGNVAGTVVTVAGKPLDLTPYAATNIARFEVKQ
jgi:cytoskeleton protein RodZ